MSEIIKEDVIRILYESDAPLSATAISKLLGFSKKNDRVCEMLDLLLEEDILVLNCDASFERYDLAEHLEEDEDLEVEGNGVEGDGDEDVLEDEDGDEVSTFDSDDVDVPEDNHGYDIDKMSKFFRITCPNNNVIDLKKSERLLVINETKKVIVHNPEDVVFAIDHYAKNVFQIRQYIVKDLSVGKVVFSQDVNTRPCIIFVQLERHNTAGI